LRVITSNRAVSLQTVALDIVRVALELKQSAQMFDRLTIPHEIRQAGDSALLVMTVDPLYTIPWFLFARDLKKGGVKVIYYGPTEGKLNKTYLRDWMREVDLIAVSNYVRDKFIEAGLNVIDTVPHGIDLKMIDQAHKMKSAALDYFKKYGLDPSKHIIITTIANSHPRKGLAFYNKVVEEVGKKEGSVKFLVITEDKGLDYFTKQDNLIVNSDFGKLPRLSILSIIANSHIIAIPSLSEGFGLPVLEAMALGTPVVHAELPPMMEFSTGFTVPIKEIAYFDKAAAGPSGIIYEQHIWDPADFANTLLQVIDYYRNKPDAIIDWRKRAWEKAKQMSIYKIYPRLLKYFYSDLPDAIDDNVQGYDFSQLPAIPTSSTNIQDEGIPEDPPATIDAEEIDINNDEIADEVLKHVVETYGPVRITKPFSFPGGDWYIKDEIIDLLTKSDASTLVEVFGGSGVISMYAPRDKFKVIIYNDKDDLLTNFFVVLKEKPDELKKKYALLPFSRSLFYKYIDMIESGEINKLDPVEKAAVFLYARNASMWGIGDSFAIETSKNLALITKRRVSVIVEYAKRWADVIIENRNFADIIQIYDREYTVFYCDPPFLNTGKTDRDHYYRLSFTEDDMRSLLNTLSNVKGKFVLKLPHDHMQYDFIKAWIEEHKYNVKEIEHALSFKKIRDGNRPRFKTLLIYNYNA